MPMRPLRRLLPLCAALLAAAPPEPVVSPAPAWDAADLPPLLATIHRRTITRDDLLARISEESIHRAILDQFIAEILIEKEAARRRIAPDEKAVAGRILDLERKLLENELSGILGPVLVAGPGDEAKAEAVQSLAASLAAGKPAWAEALRKLGLQPDDQRVVRARKEADRILKETGNGQALERTLETMGLRPEDLREITRRLLALEAVTRQVLRLASDVPVTEADQKQALLKLQTDYGVETAQMGKAWDPNIACIVGGDKIGIGRYVPFFLRRTGRNYVLFVLEDLIQRSVLEDRLEAEMKAVTQDDIDKALRDLLDRAKTRARTEDLLAVNGKTEAQIRRDVWKDLALRKLVPDPAEGDLIAYFQAHLDVYGNAEVRASDLLRSAYDEFGRPKAGTVEASFAQSRREIDEIRRRIVEGKEPWEKMVKECSEHRATRDNEEPGDLGWFPRRSRPEFEPIAAAVFEGQDPAHPRPLAIATEVSKPIWTMRGWVLVLVTNQKPPRPVAFKEIRDQVERDYLVEKKQERMEEVMKEYDRPDGLLKRFLNPPSPAARPAP